MSRFDGAGNGADHASALGVSPDGSKVFVTGSSLGTSSDYWTDYATVAYDVFSGAELWRSTYDGPASGGDTAAALAVSPDGAVVFVTGGSNRSEDGGNEDYVTVAYDTTNGAELWVSRYGGPADSFDEAAAIEVGPDGSRVFVTGFSLGSTALLDDYDYATVAYDASSGTRLWTRRYDGPAHLSDYARDIAASPDASTVVVTGASMGSTRRRYDYATIAYEASTGAMLWTKRYNGPGKRSDTASALEVSPDSSHVYVTGQNSGATSNHDIATLAYDAATGARQWTRDYNGPGNSTDGAIDVRSSPDGSSVFVTGQSIGRAGDYDFDYLTVAYSAPTGARLWVARYDGPGPGRSVDTASRLAVSPDGSRVFVAGRSTGPSKHYHYATVAYDASTGDRWLRERYNGPGRGDDSATDLGVSPSGHELFVTGYSAGSTSAEDYATLAYGMIPGVSPTAEGELRE